VKIRFFYEGAEISIPGRSSSVPTPGDVVRVHGDVFRVRRRAWSYSPDDDSDAEVHLFLVSVRGPKLSTTENGNTK